MAKEIKKLKVKVKEIWKGRVVKTHCGKTVKIPVNVEHPEVGDEIEVGEDWIGKFEDPQALIEAAKKADEKAAEEVKK